MKFVCCTSMLVLVSIHPLFAQQAVAPGEVVNTLSGKVRSTITDGISVFKSIPYAAAPVGDMKFAAPAPHAKWDTIRNPINYGPTAPFNPVKESVMDETPMAGRGWIKGDEYLAVNIWTPQARTQPMPVMVFIHGGAFALGSSDVPVFDGSAFARKGVVLVSLNYRMGIEGFLRIPGVPANLGIRDQIAALHWIRDNIAAFGGDPSNITIFGQSAGAMSVGILTVSPAAKGLFKRAIMMSGSGQSVYGPEQAANVAAAYAKMQKISNTKEAWQRLSPEEILELQPKVKPKMVKLESDEYADPTGGILLFFPWVDGEIVPDVPLRSMSKGTNAQDLLVGYTSDEANYFLLPMKLMKLVKLEAILKKAVKTVHPAPSAVLAVYRKVYPKKNRGQLLSAIVTAYQFQVPSIRFADAHAKLGGNNTFMYEFGWKSGVAEGRYGAFHAVDLFFAFNNTALGVGPRGMLGSSAVKAHLADSVQNAFIQFAKTGNPGWQYYSPAKRETMFIDNDWQLQTNPHHKELGVWEGVR